MENRCSNIVEFIGEPRYLNKLKRVFEKVITNEQKEQEGQWSGFVNTETRLLFQLRWENDTLCFETQSSPNIEAMVLVADHYGIGFAYSYTSIKNLTYGQAIYRDGILTDIFLDNTDFELVKQNEETNQFIFEKQSYERKEEILDILLESKKQLKGIK